jgi:NitT/TauT family transport system substrate-binding protein
MRLLIIAFVSALLACSPACAAKQELVLAQQFGLAYLPLMVMQDQKLVEKRARAANIKVQVKWVRFAGGGAMNDALISGAVDIAAGGVPSLILMWDKARQLGVKGLSAVNASPLYLNVNDPAITNLKDFTSKDKIALTSAKISSQAIILQMAAAQMFGPENYSKLDRLTVTMRHPDAMALLLAKTGDITGHFASAPFQYQELEQSGIKTVLNSKDVIGDATFIVTYATKSFYDEDPGLVGVYLAALKEAIELIKSNKPQAVEIYGRLMKVNAKDRPLIEKILDDPDFTFGVTPRGMAKYADFMRSTGLIQHKAQSWRDLLFPAVSDSGGD